MLCYLCPNSSKLLAYLHIRFYYTDAARVVHVPTKVQALNGITIKSVALGSEHSVAVTGTDPRFLNTCFCVCFKYLSGADGGEVLSWGGGGSGRLGHGHESSFFGILKSKRLVCFCLIPIFVSFSCKFLLTRVFIS